MTSTLLVSADGVFRPAWCSHRWGSWGPSAYCCLLQLMQIISVSDFGLWMNTEERGAEGSRSAKTTRVYYTWPARGELFSPCKIDNIPRSKILRTSQCSFHAPNIEGQADKIRRDGRAPRSAIAEEIRRGSTCAIERQEPRSRVPTDKSGDWGLYYQEC